MLDMTTMFLKEDTKPQNDLHLQEFWDRPISLRIQGKPYLWEKYRYAFIEVHGNVKRRAKLSGSQFPFLI